jgi:hypothetical protein
MKNLILVLLLAVSGYSQKAASLAVAIDSTIAVPVISKTPSVAVKSPAYIDTVIWSGTKKYIPEPEKITRQQKDIILPTYLSSKDTVEILIRDHHVKVDTMLQEYIRVTFAPIDSANAVKLRIFYQLGDFTVRSRDSTGVLK